MKTLSYTTETHYEKHGVRQAASTPQLKSRWVQIHLNLHTFFFSKYIVIIACTVESLILILSGLNLCQLLILEVQNLISSCGQATNICFSELSTCEYS